MQERSRGISRVLWQILFLNVIVAAAKAAWGIISGSTAMLADGIHSFTDGSGNVVALIAMQAAKKPPDEDHPYGHHSTSRSRAPPSASCSASRPSGW
jgi:divalent metal cation (Fe/Co/Zn/Cd) transporter